MKTKSVLFSFVFVFCTNTSINLCAQAVNVQDSLALVDLYNSTDGPNWENHSNWLSGHVDSWKGIEVEDDRVIGINLEYNNVKGSIPSSIGNLSALIYMYLDNNELTGIIPASIGNIPTLAELLLYENLLTGNIPSSLGNLNIWYLNLANNQLTGSIPSSLGNIDFLYGLYLHDNNLTGSIPSSLGKLLELYALDLSNNQLTGNIPSSLNKIQNLSSVNLSNNQLTGSIPSSFGKLKNLGELILHDNSLSGTVPSNLINCKELYSLDISYNRFTFDGMELIAQTFPFAVYNNQALIPAHQKGNALSVSAGGTLSNNTYKWFKVGRRGNTAIAGDSVFYPTESGSYFVRVYNKIAKQLILKSESIPYSVTTMSKISALSSTENLAVKKDRSNIFNAYPNPAINILYVQAQGNTPFSLTDQAGRILLTTIINVKGQINISGMSAGLYYLKNNNTHEVKKIIISR